MPLKNHIELEICEKPRKKANEFIVYSRKNLEQSKKKSTL